MPAIAFADPGEIGISARVGVGGVITGRPADNPGEPTLLYGSGFSGLGFRIAGGVSLEVVSDLKLRAELGVGRSTQQGFARAENEELELRLGLTTLELPFGVEYGFDLGPLDLFAQAGVGPRFGVAARATEERIGFSAGTPPIEVRLGTSWLVHFEAGGAVELGDVRVPFGVRWAYNLSYPNTTRERFDPYNGLDDPGAYLVENDFVILFTTGVDFEL